ncbi:MAG: hypothetical protein MK554_04285 [Planctomycetes bacterium]|nr:hypothetical protein [Planctomycetota bacterium]
MTTVPDLQKINVKFGIDAPADADWDALLNIFSRWRLEEGEEILDLADYSHVPEAPSIILVSKRWQLGVDFSRGTGEDRAGGWAGLLYASRKGLEGDLGARLRSVLVSALEKFQRLAGEKEFPRGVTILYGELDIAFNDRLLVPNNDEMDALVRPTVEEVLAALYGDEGCSVEREDDPGRRLAYCARAAGPGLEPAAALSRLG